MKQILSILGLLLFVLSGCARQTPIPVFPPTATEAVVTPVVAAPVPTSTSQPTPEPKPVEATRILQPVTIGSIHMIDSTQGMAIGGEFGFKDHFLVTNDGGYSWEDRTPEITTSETTEYPPDLVAGYWGNQDAWIASSFIDVTSQQEAVIYHSANFGLDFTPSQPLDTQGLSETFYISQITFVDQLNGWLLAHVGAGMNHDYIAIYQTLDGGLTWKRILDPSTENTVGIHSCSKDQMLFTEALHGWMTGTCNGVAPGVLLFQTMDGGISWEKMSLPDPIDQPGLFDSQDAMCGSTSPSLDETTRAFSVTVTCSQFANESISQKYYRYTTTDLGQTWQSKPYPGGFWLNLDDKNVISVGEEWQFSSDGGKNWGSAGTAGDPVMQIQVTGDGSIFALTMNETQGEILFSSDQGKSWKTILPGWE